MVRRRRFNAWDDWTRQHTTIVERDQRTVSDAELARGARWFWSVFAGVVAVLVTGLALLTDNVLQFRSRSMSVLEKRLRDPDATVRERAMRILIRDSMYRFAACTSMMRVLADPDEGVQTAAMSAVSAALQRHRCVQPLLRQLDSTQSGDDRERMLQIISGVGITLAWPARQSLLRALEHDSASNGAAAIALARTGSRDAQTIRALRNVIARGRGVARGEAVIAMLVLEPRCAHTALVRDVMRDVDPVVRMAAIQSLEPLLLDAALHCVDARQLVQSMTEDSSLEVRALARQVLASTKE